MHSEPRPVAPELKKKQRTVVRVCKIFGGVYFPHRPSRSDYVSNPRLKPEVRDVASLRDGQRGKETPTKVLHTPVVRAEGRSNIVGKMFGRRFAHNILNTPHL